MKRLGWILIALGLIWMTGCAAHDRELLGDPEPEEPAPQEEPAASEEPEAWDISQEPGLTAPADSLQMFADLRFYGSWYELYPYGWVWRPVVVWDWAPMSLGHWVWSSYGWMWVSYDAFGWAVYNYGYWVYDDFALGWVWVPTCQWQPVCCEWVAWDDYIGWCPLPPPGVDYADPWDQGNNDPWVTVPVTRFKEIEVARYKVPPKFKSGTSERTMRREPPDVGVIERGLGRSLKVVDVQLEQQAFGERQFTRVVLPLDEQAIVDQQRSKPTIAPPPPPSPGDSPPEGPTATKPEETKSKEKSTSRPPEKKESPPKFKEKAKDEKAKDSGKSKEKPKSEGESKKDGKG